MVDKREDRDPDGFFLSISTILILAVIGILILHLAKKNNPGTRPLKVSFYRLVYSLNPKSTTTIASITGAGYANIMFYGGGHPELYVRVYADEVLDSEFPADETRHTVIAFHHGFRIELYNPNDYIVIGSSPRIEVQGIITS